MITSSKKRQHNKRQKPRAANYMYINFKFKQNNIKVRQKFENGEWLDRMLCDCSHHSSAMSVFRVLGNFTICLRACR